MTDSVTKRMRDALNNSADPTDSMGVCPVCIKPPEWTDRAVKQHDLEYVMHDAGLSEATRLEVDQNLEKNLKFAAKGTAWKMVAASAVGLVVGAVGWIFW